MGVFFQKKLVGSTINITPKNLNVADFTIFKKIIVRRHSTPDTRALSNIYEKSLPIGKKFVSLQRRWGVP